MRNLPRIGLLLLLALCAAAGVVTGDPLPHWSDRAAKARIVEFVRAVTDPASPDFVPQPERIAVFDNDGTLWSEQPAYFQLLFALDRVRELAPQHPEWRTQRPFAAALAGDVAAIAAGGDEAVLELVMASHAGMTTDEFAAVVKHWLATAKHPVLKRPYTELVYEPMLELLSYLRANGFATWIVSGGGIEFVRVFSERVYGIPPEQVVGSGVRLRYEVRDGTPAIVRLPALEFLDDKAGKPVGIQRFIGRRPILAFGNSDGDFEMLEWTTSGPGSRLGLLVHHDDEKREVAYRAGSVGRLVRGLDEAPGRGWLVVSMRDDWTSVYPETPAPDAALAPAK